MPTPILKIISSHLKKHRIKHNAQLTQDINSEPIITKCEQYTQHPDTIKIGYNQYNNTIYVSNCNYSLRSFQTTEIDIADPELFQKILEAVQQITSKWKNTSSL
jgi:hypothetical protein